MQSPSFFFVLFCAFYYEELGSPIVSFGQFTYLQFLSNERVMPTLAQAGSRKPGAGTT
jgi:hypothetical protein